MRCYGLQGILSANFSTHLYLYPVPNSMPFLLTTFRSPTPTDTHNYVILQLPCIAITAPLQFTVAGFWGTFLM